LGSVPYYSVAYGGGGQLNNIIISRDIILCSIIFVLSGGIGLIFGIVSKYKYSTPRFSDVLYFLWFPIVAVIGCFNIGSNPKNNVVFAFYFLIFYSLLIRKFVKVFFPKSKFNKAINDCIDFFENLRNN
jgi:hypothetical membrane protein